MWKIFIYSVADIQRVFYREMDIILQKSLGILCIQDGFLLLLPLLAFRQKMQNNVLTHTFTHLPGWIFTTRAKE